MFPLRVLFSQSIKKNCCRTFTLSPSTYSSSRKGLILGVYEKEKEEDLITFTNAGDSFDTAISGKLRDQLSRSGPSLKKGKARTFFGVHEDFSSVVVVGLGKKSTGINELELWNEGKENIRAAVSVGCKQMQELEVIDVEVDPCGDAQAAAEGAVLGLFEYDELKKKKKKVVTTRLHGSNDHEAWQKGTLYAEGQNMARYLMEAPANFITPTKFAEILEQKLANLGSNIKIYTRLKPWIEEQKMGAFLSVAKGSEEPPVLLEIHYSGSPDAEKPPLVFVGKGVTFDRLS